MYIIPTYPPYLEKHKLPSISFDYPYKPMYSFLGNSFTHLAIYYWQFRSCGSASHIFKHVWLLLAKEKGLRIEEKIREKKYPKTQPV